MFCFCKSMKKLNPRIEKNILNLFILSKLLCDYSRKINYNLILDTS